MDKKYCPLYEGEITQYDCHEISCGAKNNYIANDGLPPLVPIEEIRKRFALCDNAISNLTLSGKIEMTENGGVSFYRLKKGAVLDS